MVCIGPERVKRAAPRDYCSNTGKSNKRRNLSRGCECGETNAKVIKEGSGTFGQSPAVHIVLGETVPGNPVTWTGPGFARVLPGAGLRFAVNNILFPMDFTIAISYRTQSAADWTVQIVVNPPGGSELCTPKTPQLEPPSFALPAATRIMLLPTPICLEPDVQYSIDVYFSQPLKGESHAHSHILVDS
ncbi:Laminin subunit beta-4, partial [Saguinus oedipus]